MACQPFPYCLLGVPGENSLTTSVNPGRVVEHHVVIALRNFRQLDVGQRAFTSAKTGSVMRWLRRP
jgi:hypothetical protein